MQGKIRIIFGRNELRSNCLNSFSIRNFIIPPLSYSNRFLNFLKLTVISATRHYSKNTDFHQYQRNVHSFDHQLPHSLNVPAGRKHRRDALTSAVKNIHRQLNFMIQIISLQHMKKRTVNFRLGVIFSIISMKQSNFKIPMKIRLLTRSQ